MTLKVICYLILLNFACVSFSELFYEWDSGNSINNVHTFAKFLDDLFNEYKKADKMDLIWHSDPHPKGLSDEQKRTVFNFTFVKWAAEFAHFNVIDDNENNSIEPYSNWNVALKSNFNNIELAHYDQSLGHTIAEKLKQINKTVGYQIMQLAFSFAARVLLCSIQDQSVSQGCYIANWQLKTLLLAYKKTLSSQNVNENNENHCIFPFKLIQTDGYPSKHLWAQSLSPAEEGWSTYDQDQQKFIANFKFILRLSNDKLSFDAIRKLLDRIMTGKLSQPFFYRFMKDQFKSLLKESSTTQRISKIDSDTKFIKCAFISFGRELANQLKSQYYEFNQYAKKYEKECGKDVHKKFVNNISSDNKPAEGSLQLEMDLFNEPLWNYARVIGYEVNCEEVVQICDALTKKAASVLAIKGFVFNSHEFQTLSAIIDEFENGKGIILNELSQFGRYSKNFGHNNEDLKKLLSDLDQIRADFTIRANEFKLIYSKGQNDPLWNKEISRFDKILYEILTKHSPKVNYDKRQQLLTFPLSKAKHIIQRLIEFVESNVTQVSDISNEFDFVNTLETVVSMKKVQIIAKRQYNRFYLIYVKLFEKLFSLAFRLCMQINGQNEEWDVKKCVKTFKLAWDQCDRSFDKIYPVFFDYKITVNNDKGMVQINLPNWNLPYFVYLEKENELKVEKAKETFNFLCELSSKRGDYPTLYEVLKMAKILHQMPDNDHVLVNSSDPNAFLQISYQLNKNNPLVPKKTKSFLYKYLYEGYDYSYHKPSNPIKVPTSGHFCILALFVKDLLAKAVGHLPTFEYVMEIEKRMANLCKEKLCTEEVRKEENLKNFGEILPNLSKMIELKLKDPYDETIRKIVPALIVELEKMLANGKENLTNLSDAKMDEWKMLEFVLWKSGQSEKWTEIQNLLKEYKTNFGSIFKTTIKILEEIKDKLEKLKEMHRIVPSGEYAIILAFGPDIQNQFKISTDKNGNFNWNFFKDIHYDKFIKEKNINKKSPAEKITIWAEKEYTKCILYSYKNYAELEEKMKWNDGKLNFTNYFIEKNVIPA